MRRIGMVVATVLLAIAGLNAAPLVQVDFGGTFNDSLGPDYQTPPGWTAMSFGEDYGFSSFAYRQSISVGAYLVSIGNQDDASLYGRGALYTYGGPYPSYSGCTLSNMCSDGIERSGWGSASTLVAFKVDGLAPTTAYDLDLWYWGGPSIATTTTLYNSTSGDVFLGSMASATTDPTSDSDYRAHYSITSDDFGSIVVTVKDFTPGSKINGLQISEIPAEVPEPATLLLVGTGALGAFGYIRRRRMV